MRSSVSQGFVDFVGLDEAVEKFSETTFEPSQKLNEAYRLYHQDFYANTDDVLYLLWEAVDEDAKNISLLNFNNAIRLIKKLDGERRVNELVDNFYRENPSLAQSHVASNADVSAFHFIEHWDEDVSAGFERSVQEYADGLQLEEVLLGLYNNELEVDLNTGKVIANGDIEEISRVIKGFKAASVQSVVERFLSLSGRFRRFSPEGGVEASDKINTALQYIVNESKVNEVRFGGLLEER